jgi:hypothetical protein
MPAAVLTKVPGKVPPGFGLAKSSVWLSPVGTKKEKVLDE